MKSLEFDSVNATCKLRLFVTTKKRMQCKLRLGMVKSGCNKKSLELDRQACVRYKALEKRDWDDRM